MKKKEKIALILIVIGLLIMAVAQADIISIAASLITKLTNVNLHAPFLSSFVFRVIVMVFGGFFLLAGGVLYRSKDEA